MKANCTTDKKRGPKHFHEITSLFSASCPFGKMSIRQNVRSVKRPSAMGVVLVEEYEKMTGTYFAEFVKKNFQHYYRASVEENGS
jgi:hypothetical protein